jgi:N-acetylmuramoyl-L-alanine amidase
MTPPRPGRSRLIAPALLLLPMLAAGPACANTGQSNPPAGLGAAAAAAIASALASDPAPGVRLLRADLRGSRLELDFSAEVAALVPGSAAFEAFSRRIHRAAGDVLGRDLASYEVHTAVAGVPLHELLAPGDAALARRALRETPDPAAPAAAALGLRRIAVSPGHGYYQNAAGNWVLQRGYWQGIIEDFVNHDMITLVRDELQAAGAEVLPTRNLDRTAGTGESGFARWQEAARYHVKALGAPASVWNEPGYDHLSQDIRCRPLWANHVNADVLVSLHNNGGGGTGSETLYDTNNGFGTESKRLADAVHGRVIAAIRREYSATWADRRVQGFNGNYGENRLATRPAILIEVAFMDRPTPDNAALQDAAFHRLVARAIREGVEDYFAGSPAVAPAAPAGLLAAVNASGVALTWTDPASNETGFRVERRAATSAEWQLLATLPANTTSYADATAAAGATHVYRVTAFNAAGAGPQSSNEATAGPALNPTAPPAREGAWLANLSLRTTLAANSPVTVGFVVSGGARDLLVRAAGPTLAAFGLAGAMADPRLTVYRGPVRAAENNDWPAPLAPVMAALGAFPFGNASRDAALLQPIDGAATAQAAGLAGGTVLVEAYDTGGSRDGRIVNLSARNRVGAGGDILIAGLYVAGTGTRRVLIRGVGPGLAALGVEGTLANPRLEVFAADGTRIAENDDWDPALAATFRSVAAFALPERSRDAALVVVLPAGRGYTAQVSGVSGTTGEALVEVYELP